jgi:hypothetical protein
MFNNKFESQLDLFLGFHRGIDHGIEFDALMPSRSLEYVHETHPDNFDMIGLGGHMDELLDLFHRADSGRRT